MRFEEVRRFEGDYNWRGLEFVSFVFCNHIEEEAKRLYYMFPQKLMEPLMPEQWREFSKVRECHICLKHFKP